jgi:hypothetical protein
MVWVFIATSFWSLGVASINLTGAGLGLCEPQGSPGLGFVPLSPLMELGNELSHAAMQNPSRQRLGVHRLGRSQSSTFHARVQVVKSAKQSLCG